LGAATVIIDCIADTNGKSGIYSNNTRDFRVSGADCYGNVSHGIEQIGGSSTHIDFEDCNFCNNGGYGISLQSNDVMGHIKNCGFGSGTAANTSGTITNDGSVEVTGTVVYATDETPWSNPGSGDFSITNDSAKQAGYGDYPGSTVGYPDIGAAQAVAAAGGGRRPRMLTIQ
jgi:hypothetical protein